MMEVYDPFHFRWTLKWKSLEFPELIIEPIVPNHDLKIQIAIDSFNYSVKIPSIRFSLDESKFASMLLKAQILSDSDTRILRNALTEIEWLDNQQHQNTCYKIGRIGKSTMDLDELSVIQNGRICLVIDPDQFPWEQKHLLMKSILHEYQQSNNSHHYIFRNSTLHTIYEEE
jgi:hypothetical protein